MTCNSITLLFLLIILSICDINGYVSNHISIIKHQAYKKSLSLYYKKKNKNINNEDNNDNNEAIDPMDVVDKTIDKNKIKSNNNDIIRVRTASDEKRLTSTEIEQMILLQEGLILKTLPTNILIVFNNLMEQIAWRFAFVATTSHVMLLIPVLRYVKLSLGMSIIPYIYIFPLLFAFPFVIYGIWDLNIATVSYIDELLLSFLINQQQLAKLNIDEQNEKFQELVKVNDMTIESIKYLAYVRLFTKINTDILKDEILALKQKTAGKKLTILSTSAELAINDDLESFPISNDGKYNTNVVNAAQTIIKVAGATGQDKRQTVNELKELQDMLSNLKNNATEDKKK